MKLISFKYVENCFVTVVAIDGQVGTVAITDTKLYVLFITVSTQDKAKVLQQLKSGFKWTIHWNKYQSKETIHAQKNF